MLARAIAVVLILAPLAAHAHGGGLDDLGCHNDRRAGGYHCHRGVLAGRSFESKAEAVLALGKKLPPHRPSSTVTPARVTTPMIVTGRVTAHRRFSTDYVIHEDAAKKARRGLWRGEFQMPWDWRAARRN